MKRINDQLVTVLIPNRNSSIYIAETLDSVLTQTYTNWECIIVDDHSTDNSLEIIKPYIEKQPDKIKLFLNTRKGACSARNVAFKYSEGDYIQYLDADDLLSPNKIEEQLKLFSQFGENILVNCKWGRFTGNKESVKWEKQPIDKDYDHPIDWLTESWMGKGMAQTAVWLTPRHLIEKAGPWNESLQINQDGEFFSRVLIHAQAIKFAPDAGVYYRSGNVQSITQNKPQSRAKAESLLRSYQSYERVLSIHDTPAIRKALGNNYLTYLYQFNSLFPDLCNKAEQAFKELGLKKMWAVGGKSFQKLVKIVGFRNALKIKKIT
ncbi:MAG: glycosyltransferase [Crenarchaeota archaeon]|nr:glycosyltransferase [Thermoproteota archaeon]